MTDKINRERPDLYEDEVGMMSVPITLESWGEEPDGPYAGYAQGISLSLPINTWISEIFGVQRADDLTDERTDRAWTAIDEVLKEYKGVETGGSGDDPDYLTAEFSVAYKDNETTDEMIDRIQQETDFRRLYNDAVIMFDFTNAIAEKLGRRKVVNDFDGDRWVDADDESPDVYYRDGERHVVPHPGGF